MVKLNTKLNHVDERFRFNRDNILKKRTKFKIRRHGKHDS